MFNLFMKKIWQKCNLCELTYATKSGVRRHVKNVHGPTPTSEFDTNSSTDENDGDSDDYDANENNTDEDSEKSSDHEEDQKTSTPVPNDDNKTTKGQIISEWILDVFIWTKKPTKIFLS